MLSRAIVLVLQWGALVIFIFPHKRVLVIKISVGIIIGIIFISAFLKHKLYIVFISILLMIGIILVFARFIVNGILFKYWVIFAKFRKKVRTELLRVQLIIDFCIIWWMIFLLIEASMTPPNSEYKENPNNYFPYIIVLEIRNIIGAGMVLAAYLNSCASSPVPKDNKLIFL